MAIVAKPGYFGHRDDCPDVKSLAAAVEEWRRRVEPDSIIEGCRDIGVEVCGTDEGSLDALRRVIALACESRHIDGHMHTHQTKVTLSARRDYYRALCKRMNDLMDAVGFVKVHKICHEAASATHGIGEVTTYDVATRLAAALHVPVLVVYLHAGVREGFRALGLAQTLGNREYLQLALLPTPIAALPDGDWAEDFLCGFRHVLGRFPVYDQACVTCGKAEHVCAICKKPCYHYEWKTCGSCREELESELG